MMESGLTSPEGLEKEQIKQLSPPELDLLQAVSNKVNNSAPARSRGIRNNFERIIFLFGFSFKTNQFRQDPDCIRCISYTPIARIIQYARLTPA